MKLKKLLRNWLEKLSRITPNLLPLNYLLALPVFCAANRRFPVRPENPRAAINDYIFHRMIRNRWNSLERACVDKEYAKTIARGLYHDIILPRTIEIFHVHSGTNVVDISDLIEKYRSKKVVLKTTHNSGDIVFGKSIKKGDAERLFTSAKSNAFHVDRETQYATLEKKIIVEEDISWEDHPPIDFKFFCVRGCVLFCQVDTSRFSGHRRELFWLPDFNLIPVETGLKKSPAKQTKKPSNLDELLLVAKNLSEPFDFVRVDLYNTPSGIAVGEFTFSPGAAADPFSDENFGIAALKAVKHALDPLTFTDTRSP
jgi:TupA-like ATPgrasp